MGVDGVCGVDVGPLESVVAVALGVEEGIGVFPLGSGVSVAGGVVDGVPAKPLFVVPVGAIVTVGMI